MRWGASAFVASWLLVTHEARAAEPRRGDAARASEATDGDVLVGPEDPAPTDPIATEEDLAEDAALADVGLEVESIAVRLRRLRAARAPSSLWPRVTVHLSWTRGVPEGLAREAGVPEVLSLGAHRGLTWSIFATWGAR